MSKIKIEDIKSQVEQAGWKLISTSYSNLNQELNYTCPHGHTVIAPWKEMRERLQCPICEQAFIQYNIIPKTKERRVIGIDQATHISGWSVFDGQKLIAYGKYQTQRGDEIFRINSVKNWLLKMIKDWQPDKIAIEEIQLQDDSNNKMMGIPVFQQLARLQGVLLDTLYCENIEYEICHTGQWRDYNMVKGSTREQKKRSMQEIVKNLYNIDVTDDEADAIGIGKYAARLPIKTTIYNWE